VGRGKGGSSWVGARGRGPMRLEGGSRKTEHVEERWVAKGEGQREGNEASSDRRESGRQMTTTEGGESGRE